MGDVFMIKRGAEDHLQLFHEINIMIPIKVGLKDHIDEKGKG